MNINELEELAKEWNRFDADNEYSQSFLELIAAYREAVAALVHIQRCIPINGFAQIHHERWGKSLSNSFKAGANLC